MSNPLDHDTDAAGVRSRFVALLRGLPYVIVAVGFVAAATFYVLGNTQPVYRAVATVLVVPGGDSLPGEADAEREAIGGQVQFVRSRDIARSVVQKLDLAAYPEFGAEQDGFWLDRVLAVVGLVRPSAGATPEERVLNAYLARLSVSADDASRVIAVEFSSQDAALAAAVANAVADEFVALQRAAGGPSAAEVEALAAGIAAQRARVRNAEMRIERYREEHGADVALPSPRRIADLEAELGRVGTARAEADARSAQIRSLIEAGGGPGLADVPGATPLIRRLVERQAAVKAQMARVEAMLLPQHPRMRALAAEIADLDGQISAEAARMVASVEAEAQRAEAREAAIGRELAALRSAATAAAGLAALEREAAAQRSQLESLVARSEAPVAEDNGYLPTDVRILSPAEVPAEPAFPQVLPMTLAAALAAFVLSMTVLLLRVFGGAPRAMPVPRPMPFAESHARWADDRSVRRMMPAEPTLVPEMADRVQESLSDIAGDIVRSGKKRVLVTMAEGSDSDGRPLGAVALARALARTDARVVLVDLRGDGANAQSMGEGGDLPGFSDLFTGDASFAQVIFRDRKSRVHFIPAGRRPLSPARLDRAQMETILSALTLTYDYVLLDASDEMIGVVGPACDIAMVVSEFAATDRRTVSAFRRIAAVIEARPLLLVVDPPSPAPTDAGFRAAAEFAA